jgi:hypothetical protein
MPHRRHGVRPPAPRNHVHPRVGVLGVPRASGRAHPEWDYSEYSEYSEYPVRSRAGMRFANEKEFYQQARPSAPHVQKPC